MKRKILKNFSYLRRLESWLLILLLLPSFVLAQAVQPCVVKQYNQKDAKTPLAGVQVEVRGAGTEVSDAQGLLTLNFATLKSGDRVVKRGINKEGYEIFNTSAVEQWTISRDRTPFQIVLVRSDYMRQLKQTLRDNSLENYKLKYEQTKKQLKKEQEAGKLKDEEYRKEMEKLEDQYDNALKDLDNYIDQFAHFDLNEVSAEEQRILDMVQQGQIDEAVKAYENLQLSEKLLQERADLKKLDEASARIEEEKARKEENISALREALDREITTLKLAGGRDNFEKIAQILKEQALADTTDYEAVEKYADFLFQQRDYSESIHYFNICLQLEKGNTTHLATTCQALGNVYGGMNDYNEAEKYHVSSLNYYSKLFESDSAILAQVASAQISLANTYRHLRDTIMAKQYLELGLDNSQKAFSDDSTKRQSYFFALHSMACLQMDCKNYTEAIKYFEEAFELGSIICKQDEDFRSAWTFAMTSLAHCYFMLHDFDMAEKYYLRALEEFEILAKQNPKSDLPGLASTQKKIADLYDKMGEYEKKQKYNIDALNSYYMLFQWDSSMSRRRAIETLQTSVGLYYHFVNYDYVTAEQYYLAALRHINILVEYDSIQYLPHLTLVQAFLGSCYYDSENFAESEKYCLDALENYELLSKKGTAFGTKSIAVIQKELGDIYYSREDFANAETYYLLALENKLVLMQQDTSAYCQDVTNLELNLARIYLNTSSFDKSEQFYLKSLEHATWLYQRDSTTYRAGVAMIQQELGESYAAISELSKAELYYLSALENKKNLMQQDTTAYCEDVTNLEYTIARINANGQNNEKAERYYLSALEHCAWLYAHDKTYSVGMAMIYNELSYCYARTDRFPQALNTIEKAIAFAPNEPNYYDSKGEILLMSDDEKGALEMWQKVLELDPDFLKHLEENGSASELYKGLKEKRLVK